MLGRRLSLDSLHRVFVSGKRFLLDALLGFWFLEKKFLLDSLLKGFRVGQQILTGFTS